MYETAIVNPQLVEWLTKEGADKHMVHDFVLEKGMGERLELQILSKNIVSFTFYGKEDLRSDAADVTK